MLSPVSQDLTWFLSFFFVLYHKRNNVRRKSATFHLRERTRAESNLKEVRKNLAKQAARKQLVRYFFVETQYDTM